MSEKKWEFRALCAKDVFPIASVVSKIGVGEFLKMFTKMDFKEGAEVEAGMAVMAEGAQLILANLDKCEKDIYTLLASVSNLTVKEVQELTMGEFVEMIVDFVKKDDFGDFFKQVSSLLN